jgi:hypothetical protein
MKQIRSPFLISLIGLFCLFAHPAHSTIVGLVKATCISERVVLAVAKADEHSPTEGGEVFTHFLKLGKCGILIYPQVMPLEKKIHAYVDTKKEETEVWKIKNTNHYAIMAAEFVNLKGKPEKSI